MRPSLVLFFLTLGISPCGAQEEPPSRLRKWLKPQVWFRDTGGPVLSLGSAGSFDDTHIFAPCVAFENERYRMWYCGSRGTVAERVFRMGLATSRNGRRFALHPRNPVHEFGDGKHSILTPALLRNPDGSLLREAGKLRMWFSATHFSGKSGLHTLHESVSANGTRWSAPSPPQLEHVYAPTVIRENDVYRMWYTDVSGDPWIFRTATSRDGRAWKVRKEPVLRTDQDWERRQLFYPTVLKVDGVYLMWYGSYWTTDKGSNKTALGLAASLDGVTWFKNPHNPVVRPDPHRPWESHYATSQSILRLPDGSFRIWYASRKKPPFTNKYFAINTARWVGPQDRLSIRKTFIPEDVDFERPLYQSSFDDETALEDWKLEGGRKMSVANGSLVLESDPENRRNHLVCWLKKEMPADFLLEFTVWPENRKDGLNIVFFNARGLKGESIFDPALAPRDGLFKLYHSGDLNNYHISYWAAGRDTTHIRKNKGFHKPAVGKDLVDGGPDGFQTIRIYKRGGKIRLMVDDVVSLAYDDDGKTYGPVHAHSGWIGLRQMGHARRCEYGHVRIFSLKP